MVRSNMDGRTLAEKRYGKEYRPELAAAIVVTFDHCAADACSDPVGCTMEVYVDDSPPALDWVTRMLAKMYARYGRAWITVPFCIGHGTAMMQAGLDYIDSPDLWAPHRENPPVFPHPLKMIQPELIVARG